MDKKEKTPYRPFQDYIPDEAWEHAQAARQELRQSFEALLPPGFVKHRRAARREMLLALRSVIDAALKRAEASESDAQ